jgi:hypothetical protein
VILLLSRSGAKYGASSCSSRHREQLIFISSRANTNRDMTIQQPNCRNTISHWSSRPIPRSAAPPAPVRDIREARSIRRKSTDGWMDGLMGRQCSAGSLLSPGPGSSSSPEPPPASTFLLPMASLGQPSPCFGSPQNSDQLCLSPFFLALKPLPHLPSCARFFKIARSPSTCKLASHACSL